MDEPRSIAKAFGGFSGLSKMIVRDNGSHRITESEIVDLAKIEADAPPPRTATRQKSDAWHRFE
jgi:hypothetical protein